MTAASSVSATIALGSRRRTGASTLPYARPQASVTAEVVWAPDLTDRVRLTPRFGTGYEPVLGLAASSDQRIATTVPFGLPALACPIDPANLPIWRANFLGPSTPLNDVRVVGPNVRLLTYDIYLRAAGIAETAGVPLQIPAGTTLQAAVTTDLHQAGDWLGVFRVGAPDGNEEFRQVLPDMTTETREGSGAVPVFRVSFQIPTTGQYEVRFFDGTTGAFLGQSGTITVVGGPGTTTRLLTVNGQGAGEDIDVAPGEALVAVLAGSAFGAADVLEVVRDDDHQVFTLARALAGNQDIPFVVPQPRGVYQLQWRSTTPAGLVRGPVLARARGRAGSTR